MALKQVPVTDAASATHNVNYQEEVNGSLTPLARLHDARDQRGLQAHRPAAPSVPVGTTYWSVDTGDVEVSDGSTWRSV